MSDPWQARGSPSIVVADGGGEDPLLNSVTHPNPEANYSVEIVLAIRNPSMKIRYDETV